MGGSGRKSNFCQRRATHFEIGSGVGNRPDAGGSGGKIRAFGGATVESAHPRDRLCQRRFYRGWPQGAGHAFGAERPRDSTVGNPAGGSGSNQSTPVSPHVRGGASFKTRRG